MPASGDDGEAVAAGCCAACRSAYTPITSARCSSGKSIDFRPVLDVSRHRARGRGPRTSAPTSRRRTPLSCLMKFGGRPERDRGDVAEADRVAARRVDEDVADVVDAVARLGHAPDLDVVGLAVAEDVADLLAGHERGRGAADVARLDRRTPWPWPGRRRPRPAARRVCSSTLTSSTPLILPSIVLDLLRLGSQDLEVRAERCGRRSARSRRRSPR